MTREVSGAPSQLGMTRVTNSEIGDNLLQQYGSSWYLSKQLIEKFSPSRKDGIDFRKESEIRFTYSTFLHDFGKRFGLPLATIATAIIFCHRFYLNQSHARNDWRTMAPACLFLASKVEDTAVSLDHVVKLSYEMIYKKDPTKQKDVFEKQKALILIAERLLMPTIRFGFEVQHPYSPLSHALKKFGMTGKDVRQYALNCINDTLRTTLCLQYKPHYIAAGALYLAIKFSKKDKELPLGQGYSWWHEFDVTPKLLPIAIQEMRDLSDDIRRLAETCAAGKPIQTPLLAKKVISKSPESCVLSSSSQCSSGGGGWQRPAVTIICKTIRKIIPDVVPAPVAVQAELRSKAKNLASPDSVVEDSQGPGEDVDQIEVKPRQAVDIKDYHKSGETIMKMEQNEATVASSKDSQGSDECMDHSMMKPEHIEDAVSCHGPSDGANHVRVPDQASHTDDILGTDELMNESRMSPEPVADADRCPGPGDGADQARTPEKVAETDGLSKSCQRMNESVMTPDQISDQARTPEQVMEAEGLGSAERMSNSCPGPDRGADQAWTPEQFTRSQGCQGSDQSIMIPEQVADVVVSHGNGGAISDLVKAHIVISFSGPGEGADQARTLEQFTLGQSCQRSDQGVDKPRMKPERDADIGNSHGNGEAVNNAVVPEQVTTNVSDLLSVKPEQVAAIEGYAGCGEGLEQTTTKGKRVEAEQRPEMIKFLMKKLKMEREIPSRFEIVIPVDIPRKPEKVTDGLDRLDMERIRALVKKRKREREINERKKAMDECGEDDWIEKELESGIELRVDSKKEQKVR